MSKLKTPSSFEAILISGIGGLAIQIPYAFDDKGAVAKTIQITAIATALIIGIVTNTILSKVGKSSDEAVSDDKAQEGENDETV